MNAPIADLPAERSWLGYVLRDARTLEVAPIPLADFYSRKHSMIAGAMLALRARGEPIELVTVRTELARSGDLQRAGGDELLMELGDTGPSTRGEFAVARHIRETARLRGLSESCHRVLAAIDERDSDRVGSLLAELTLERDVEDEVLPFAELLARGVEATLHAKDRGDDLRLGTPSIDRDYRPGPGHLVVVAGRPNVGKTSLTFAWHLDCAHRAIPSGIVSIDDDAIDYGARGVGAISGVNPSRLWNERLGPGELKAILQAVARASDAHRLPVHFAHVRSKKIDQIEAVITRMVRVFGARFVSLDFISKVRAPGRDARERLDEALARMGVLASTLRIPIIVLAQLRRLGVDQYREPQLDDLKESGRLEEDAQAAVLLWRESDQPGVPLRAKLAKIKRTAAGRRFLLRRHPNTGLLVESDESYEEPRRGPFDD